MSSWDHRKRGVIGLVLANVLQPGTFVSQETRDALQATAYSRVRQPYIGWFRRCWGRWSHF